MNDDRVVFLRAPTQAGIIRLFPQAIRPKIEVVAWRSRGRMRTVMVRTRRHKIPVIAFTLIGDEWVESR